jgi:serine/threonine-protein kinase RsbW
MTRSRGPLRLTITVPADASKLRLLTGVVRRCLVDGAGIYPSDAIYHQIQLAVREACSNVVKHSYAGLRPGMLRLRLRVGSGGVLVDIEDRGMPFPQGKLIQIAASEESGPEEPAEGGFGLKLMRKTMDRVTYGRKPNGANIVRLYKKLDRAA